jgi:hypothetical protein
MSLTKKLSYRRINALLLLLAVPPTLCLSGCAIGFNKNGFYCTEGPVTDDTPSCFGNASNASRMYSVTLQSEYGIEKQTVIVPVGGETREQKMAGGIVQITPPKQASDQSVFKFFANSGASPTLMHTASVTTPSDKPLTIAYTICGQSVRFESPAPEKLENCSTVAER